MTERVPAALDGERVDRVVSLVTGLNRAEAAALVAGGRVLVGGRPPASRGRRVHAGEALEIDAPPPAAADGLQPDPTVEVPVVWVDEELIVVDKPAGMIVHPGAGHSSGTLVQGLLAAFPDLAALAVGGEAERPGVVQRLDRGTSGLLVVARTTRARDSLVAQLSGRNVDRAYSALVAGAVEEDAGLVDAPLGRDPSDPLRVSVQASGRSARTRYRVQRRYSRPYVATLLECRLETGRTHQIRAHLAAIGHPVAGDDRYGGATVWPEGSSTGRRPFLHARMLGFEHPVSGRRLNFESPLPPELEAVLAAFDQTDAGRR